MEMTPELLAAAQAASVEPPRRAVRVSSGDLPLEGWESPGSGTGRWKTLFCGDRTPTSDMVLGVAEFGPGETLEPHRHSASEVYYCTEGTGVVTVDGELHEMSPGVAVFLPGDAEHGVVAGPGGLKFVYSFPRPRFSDIDYRFSAGQA